MTTRPSRTARRSRVSGLRRKRIERQPAVRGDEIDVGIRGRRAPPARAVPRPSPSRRSPPWRDGSGRRRARDRGSSRRARCPRTSSWDPHRRACPPPRPRPVPACPPAFCASTGRPSRKPRSRTPRRTSSTVSAGWTYSGALVRRSTLATPPRSVSGVTTTRSGSSATTAATSTVPFSSTTSAGESAPLTSTPAGTPTRLPPAPSAAISSADPAIECHDAIGAEGSVVGRRLRRLPR